jgi:talin
MGLRNPEEFSLQWDDKPGTDDRSAKKRKAKLKKASKLKEGVWRRASDFSSDNDGWLNPAQALAEQGIPEDAVLTWRKKYWVDDDRVDPSNPFQMYLMYIQAHEGIVKGDHLVSNEEAVMFAALQCQIVFGNFDAEKHTKAFFKDKKTRDMVAPIKRKERHLYDEVVKEWKKLVNTSEVNAKFRYVQLSRSLKTYGITYYPGKWKPVGKKRLENVLLGVTKETILCLDPDSRQVIEEHPLTHLKRWAAGPNSFTLDFGDYRDGYMTIGTALAEAASQQLAGYIDILLRRRRPGPVVIEEDDAAEGVVEHVAAVHGVAVQSATTIGFGGSAADGGSNSMLTGGGQIAGLSPGLMGLIGQVASLADADNAILNLINDLMKPFPIGQHGNKSPADLRQELARHNMALAASAGALIKEAGSGSATREGLGKHSQGLTLNLANVIGAARQAAAASAGDISLLDGAKAVSDALAKLLGAAGAMADDPSVANRASLLEAASLLQASMACLNATTCGNYADEESTKLLLATSLAVAAATKQLLQSADAPGNSAVTKQALRVTQGNETLTAMTAAAAPVLADANCQHYVVDAAKALSDACQGLISSTPTPARDEQRNDLSRAVKLVNESLQQLVNTTQCVGTRAQAHREAMTVAAFEIQDAVARIMSSEGNPNLISTASRAVAGAQATLINAAKVVASSDASPEEQTSLLTGVTRLTNAVKAMLAAAGTAATDPTDHDLHRKLRESAIAVAEAAKGFLGTTSIKDAALAALRTAGKALAASTTALVVECHGVSAQLDTHTKHNLQSAAGQAATAVSNLIAGVRDSWNNPNVDTHDQNLLAVSGSVARPASGLVATALGCAAQVKDAQNKKALNMAAASVSDSLRKLLEALSAAKAADGHMEVGEAMQDLKVAQADLEHALLSAQEGSLQPLSAHTRNGAVELLEVSMRTLREASDELVSNAKISPQAMGPSAKATVSATTRVFGAAKAVAAITDSKPLQYKILCAAKELSAAVERLVNAARAASTDQSDAELDANLANARSAVGKAVDQLLVAATNSGLGSLECDNASEFILRSAVEILTGYADNSSDLAHLEEIAGELNFLFRAVDATLVQLVDCARTKPKALGEAANLVASAIPPVLKVANLASTKTSDEATGETILKVAKKLATDTAALLQSAKAVAASPDDRTKQQHLGREHKTARDDMKELLRSVDAAIPGKKELLEAQSIIAFTTMRFTQPPIGSVNSQAHLREVTDAARALAEAVGRIVASARNCPEKLGAYGKQAAESACEIVDAAKDASASDLAALVFLSTMKLASAAKKLAEDPSDVAAVIQTAEDAARDASALMQCVKKAALLETDATARRKLIQDAEQCAAATQGVAYAAKAIVARQSGAEQKLLAAASGLQSQTAQLMTYHRSSGPNFCPLLGTSRGLIDEVEKMLSVLKATAGKPQDAANQAQLTLCAKSTTEAIKQLIQVAEGLTFGHKEYKEAIELIQRAIGDLDAAAVSATVGLLESQASAGVNQKCKEELVLQSRELGNAAAMLVTAVKNEPANFGPAVHEISVAVLNIVASSRRLASSTTDSDTQQKHLQQAKNVVDAVLHMTIQARAASLAKPGGKKDDQPAIGNLVSSARSVSSAITELVSLIKGNIQALRACDDSIKAIETQLATASTASSIGSKVTYAQASMKATEHAKELASSIAILTKIAKNSSEKIGSASTGLVPIVSQLLKATGACQAITTDEAVRAKLRSSVDRVVGATMDAIATAKNVVADPKSSVVVAQMLEQQHATTKAIGALLATINEGSTLERDAEYATARIHSTIADLDNASLFASATAGLLEVTLPEGTTLDSCQQSLNGLLVSETLAAINSISSSSCSNSQDALGKAFRHFADSVERACKGTKGVASLLHDLVAQQHILAAAKAAAISSLALVLASKEATIHPEDAAAKENVQEKLASASAAFDHLIRVSSDVTAAAIKGVRELENAEKEISQQLVLFASSAYPGNKGAIAEDVVKAARIIASSSGNIVNACTNDNEGLVDATRRCSKGVCLLLADAKGAAMLSNDPKIQSGLLSTVKATATATLALLSAAKTAKDTPQSQKNMAQLSEQVADRILEVVAATRRLPGGAGLRLEEAAGEDLEALAEKELMKAAKMIEEAAKTCVKLFIFRQLTWSSVCLQRVLSK